MLQAPENLFEVFYPFSVLLRAFGLFPSSFNGQVRHGNFIFKVEDKIWLTIVMTVFGILGVFNIFDEHENQTCTSKLLERAAQLNGIICVVMVILCIIYGTTKVENCRLLLEMCCNFDIKVFSFKLLYNFLIHFFFVF